MGYYEAKTTSFLAVFNLGLKAKRRARGTGNRNFDRSVGGRNWRNPVALESFRQDKAIGITNSDRGTTMAGDSSRKNIRENLLQQGRKKPKKKINNFLIP